MTSGQHTPVVRIARQSIVDRNRTVQAFELLFRGTVDPERGFDGTEASATSLVTAMLDIGWDHLRGGHPLYLNVDQDFLLSRLVHVAPPESTVVELVGGVVDSPEVHAAVLELKSLGFKIAIDDFMGQDDVEQLLHLADVVKVDRLDIALDELTAIVELVHQRNALALAERVEDEETFQRCLEAGFDLFEGYHFDRPQPQEGGVTASQAVSLQLATLLQSDSPDPAEIEHLLRADVGLSYRVLRLANSSASGRDPRGQLAAPGHRAGRAARPGRLGLADAAVGQRPELGRHRQRADRRPDVRAAGHRRRRRAGTGVPGRPARRRGRDPRRQQGRGPRDGATPRRDPGGGAEPRGRAGRRPAAYPALPERRAVRPGRLLGGLPRGAGLAELVAPQGCLRPDPTIAVRSRVGGPAWPPGPATR